jgi:hypothetical protein
MRRAKIGPSRGEVVVKAVTQQSSAKPGRRCTEPLPVAIDSSSGSTERGIELREFAFGIQIRQVDASVDRGDVDPAAVHSCLLKARYSEQFFHLLIITDGRTANAGDKRLDCDVRKDPTTLLYSDSSRMSTPSSRVPRRM